MRRNFIEIDDIILNPEIFETKFTCDLEKCKGACCTMESEYGAPIKQEEIDKINGKLHIIKEYLPKRHVDEIETNGFWMEKYGQLMTQSVDNKACVFVYFDNEIARCGIEKAYEEGKINFQKPISCHLFPIRVSEFGGDILRFEEYSECQPALQKGEETKLTVLEFCKDSLKRLYGSQWFEKAKHYLGN
ncbi:MAG: DUF3109 family protein [Ignavibacteriales bacterium]|jgi:hypothetical protein|nr:MAG: DUF3109 family protein [Ignavibacteriales bacterium]